MDFLKSCTTNLYAVEGYSSIEYQIYTAPQADADATASNEKDAEAKAHTSPPWVEERHIILLELRRRGALAQSAAVQKKICVFGGFQQAEQHMKELRWPLALTGRLEVSSLSRLGPDVKANVTNQNIYGMFLSAVEESLSITLGHMCRAIRVAHMNWLIPTDGQDDAEAGPESPQEYSLLTLRTQITSIGTILLLPEVVASGFSTLSHAADGAKTILLAPSGTPASMADQLSALSVRDGESDANKSGRQSRREARARLARQAREEQWKSSVKSRLANSTAVPDRLDDLTHWTCVKVPSSKLSADSLAKPTWDHSRPGQSCLWPTKLCFENMHDSDLATLLGNDDLDWVRSGTYKDPLAAAEQWYSAKNERDEVALAEKRRIQAEAEREVAASQIFDPPPDQAALSSPVNMRAQDQGSVNGIYPTPPDGLPPGVFADTVPSTTNPDETVPTVATEEVFLTRQPSHEPAVDVLASRKNSTDALFDDMDEEMFGAPDVDVTDADFSFFDDTDAPTTKRRRSSHRERPPAVIVPPDISISGDVNEVALEDGPLTAPPTAPEISQQENGTEPMDVADEADAVQDLGGDAHDAVGDCLPAILPKSAPPQSDTPIQPKERSRSPPLSPLQIKERFLPSPAPSRIGDQVVSSDRPRTRRSSNFNPVVFKGNISSFDAKYGNTGRFSAGHPAITKTGPPTLKPGRSSSIIDLPSRRYNPKFRRLDATSQAAAVEEVSDDSSSDESDTSDADSASSWQSAGAVSVSVSGKRKRMLADDGASVHSPRVQTDNESDVESTISDDRSVGDYNSVLDLLVSRDGQRDSQRGVQESQHKFADKPSIWKDFGMTTSSPSTRSENDLWDLFDFSQEDLINIAQLVAQQSINPDSNNSHRDIFDQSGSCESCYSEGRGDSVAATLSAAHDAVKHVFSSASDCDFSRLGSVISIHAEQAQAPKNQPPRPVPPPRRPAGGAAGAQHLFAIQPPSVNLQRSGASWEMLPSSLSFWESLSLEPANGPKHVSAYAIYPETGDFADAVGDFLDNIGVAYENCKLGSHVRGATHTDYHDGLVGFSLPENPSTRTIIENMRSASVAFGEILREEASLDADRAVIVYMFSPTSDDCLTKYLCGCFWAIQQALAVDSDPGDDPLPDFVLQIVPINRIASPDCLALPEPTWLSSLASQVYDRVPLREPYDHKSVWVIPSAPSIQLTSPTTRKINFTLHERPPKSLLEEAQILHVAYAVSTDSSWLTAAWSDNTGKYQFNTSFSIKNLSGKATLSEVRDMTLSLARTTTWRIFVAKVGTMRNWEKEVWKEVPSDSYTLTLLDVDTLPLLHISATEATANHPAIPGSNAAASFLTPASTPQPANFTVSPEAYGNTASATGNNSNNAPGTPVPDAEPSAPDPDAYLIDTTDESWGLVLPFSAVHGPYELKRTMASGLLLKRGSAPLANPAFQSTARKGGSNRNLHARDLPSLGVDIVDMLMPKLVEGQAQWLSLRTADAALKEVLSWYRGLGLLSRLRGLDERGVVPWHVCVAVRGVEALEGFLD